MSQDRPEARPEDPGQTADEPRAETAQDDAQADGADGGATSEADAGAEAREALARLGERARSIVEELTRSARQREQASKSREAAARAREEAAAFSQQPSGTGDPDQRISMLDAAMPELHRRLAELRACIGEVSDVLEATLERLETVEEQLGAPDQSVERTIADGISRCERMLSGIEHRISRAGPVEAAAAPALPGTDRSARTVVVVARASALRAGLCIALERQGLFALAALDAMGARRAIDRSGGAAAALLCFTGSDDDRLLAMEQWKSAEKGELLPKAAVWITREDPPAAERDAAVCELPVLLESHGEAALAAGLLELTKTREQPAGDEDRTCTTPS